MYILHSIANMTSCSQYVCPSHPYTCRESTDSLIGLPFELSSEEKSPIFMSSLHRESTDSLMLHIFFYFCCSSKDTFIGYTNPFFVFFRRENQLCNFKAQRSLYVRLTWTCILHNIHYKCSLPYRLGSPCLQYYHCWSSVKGALWLLRCLQPSFKIVITKHKFANA